MEPLDSIIEEGYEVSLITRQERVVCTIMSNNGEEEYIGIGYDVDGAIDNALESWKEKVESQIEFKQKVVSWINEKMGEIE